MRGSISSSATRFCSSFICSFVSLSSLPRKITQSFMLSLKWFRSPVCEACFPLKCAMIPHFIIYLLVVIIYLYLNVLVFICCKTFNNLLICLIKITIIFFNNLLLFLIIGYPALTCWFLKPFLGLIREKCSKT